jgi:hypothetical protein
VTDVQACCPAEETNCFMLLWFNVSIPEVTEDFDLYSFVYSLPFCNKLVVDEILIIREHLQQNLTFSLVQLELFFWK